ncbi:MAG TPA: B12-binding domain-containing radical SAM protein, partial [Candidatus Hypogeohydataceae bacterium YC38]
WCKGKRIAGIKFPPMSLVSVVTVLRAGGQEAELLDAAAQGLDMEALKSAISSFDIIVMLTSTMTLNEDTEVLKELKKVNPRVKTILFGGHVTAEPQTTLAREGVDIVVRREAEYIIRDLAKAMEEDNGQWQEVRGISFLEKGKYCHNPDYPLIQNLDELPIPDRSMLPKDLDYFNPVVKRMPYTTMFTSRGCPGRCTFCSSPSFYGNSLRFRSTEAVLREMEEVASLGYKEVFFRDEIFTASKRRVMEICQGIKERKIDITWICSARIGSIDLNMMKAMKEAGCHMIRLGVESGVQELLDNVHKGITVEQTRRTLKWAHEVGLDVHAHLMIGLPGENKSTLEETMRFVKEIDPTIVTFGIMTPYPGTPLFEELRRAHPQMGDGTSVDLKGLHTTSFYNEYFTQLTPKELSLYIRKVYKNFYMRPGYVLKWLSRIKSMDEFKRVVLAGTQVFEFIHGGD